MCEFIIDYTRKMKCIQGKILEYFLNNELEEDKLYILQQFLNENKISENKKYLKATLKLFSNITNNIQRQDYFYSKLERFIEAYKEVITTYFSNYEIFKIFQKNKLILLILFEKNIIIPNRRILNNIKKKNLLFFLPEFKDLYDYEKNFDESDIEKDSEKFREKRKLGENDEYICQLIRKDSIDEFIIYVNRTNKSLSSVINESIFETNPFLMKNEFTLIEYAAFYGSIQIFQYLRFNKVLLNSSLWSYAMHGQNADIIHLLEENNVIPSKQSFLECYKEAIKCYNFDIMNYIKDKMDVKNDLELLTLYFKYFNFDDVENIEFSITDISNSNLFYYLCKLDYFDIVNYLLKNSNIDVNKKIVTKLIINQILIFVIFLIKFLVNYFISYNSNSIKLIVMFLNYSLFILFHIFLISSNFH